MAKQKPAPTDPPPPFPPPSKALSIDITPSPDARAALTVHQQAQAVLIVDKVTHASALEFLRGAKQLKRKIEDHWSRITRSVDDLKKNLLTLKREDVGPVDAAIATIEQKAIAYQDGEARRVREENERIRREAEETARIERERQLAAQEAEAAKLEDDAADLSEREQAFVDGMLAGWGDFKSASRAGYAQPRSAAERLLSKPKIVKAIEAARAAVAIRQQAAALAAAPLEVAPTQAVERQTAKIAGVSNRMYYSAEVVDEVKFYRALFTDQIPLQSVIANMPELNRQATQLKDLFEAAYPGCRLVKTPRIGG